MVVGHDWFRRTQVLGATQINEHTRYFLMKIATTGSTQRRLMVGNARSEWYNQLWSILGWITAIQNETITQ